MNTDTPRYAAAIGAYLAARGAYDAARAALATADTTLATARSAYLATQAPRWEDAHAVRCPDCGCFSDGRNACDVCAEDE